jgi:hypothetical protein
MAKVIAGVLQALRRNGGCGTATSADADNRSAQNTATTAGGVFTRLTTTVSGLGGASASETDGSFGGISQPSL